MRTFTFTLKAEQFGHIPKHECGPLVVLAMSLPAATDQAIAEFNMLGYSNVRIGQLSVVEDLGEPILVYASGEPIAVKYNRFRSLVEATNTCPQE